MADVNPSDRLRAVPQPDGVRWSRRERVARLLRRLADHAEDGQAFEYDDLRDPPMTYEPPEAVFVVSIGASGEPAVMSAGLLDAADPETLANVWNDAAEALIRSAGGSRQDVRSAWQSAERDRNSPGE